MKTTLSVLTSLVLASALFVGCGKFGLEKSAMPGKYQNELKSIKIDVKDKYVIYPNEKAEIPFSVEGGTAVTAVAGKGLSAKVEITEKSENKISGKLLVTAQEELEDESKVVLTAENQNKKEEKSVLIEKASLNVMISSKEEYYAEFSISPNIKTAVNAKIIEGGEYAKLTEEKRTDGTYYSFWIPGKPTEMRTVYAKVLLSDEKGLIKETLTVAKKGLGGSHERDMAALKKIAEASNITMEKMMKNIKSEKFFNDDNKQEERVIYIKLLNLKAVPQEIKELTMLEKVILVSGKEGINIDALSFFNSSGRYKGFSYKGKVKVKVKVEVPGGGAVEIVEPLK